MRWTIAFITTIGLLVGSVAIALDSTPVAPVTLTFVGDVMLGRGVAPVAAADPDGLFADVRFILRNSDLTLGNLESALTTRPHVSAGPNDLIAHPTSASLLGSAGFDVVSLANNHVGDAGPDGVLDTLAAVETAGLRTVGGGVNRAAASEPLHVEISGLHIAVLAFDATGAGLAARAGPGVAKWDPDEAREATEAATAAADIVIVSVHGGVEYLPESDPRMLDISERLVDWGADVVWGHGPHVVAPITTVPTAGGESAIVATSLGNFLFDQRGPDTGRGVILQVMVDPDGVIAHRTGSTSHHDLRVHFTGWDAPISDAALLDGAWWNLVRRPTIHSIDFNLGEFGWGEVTAAAIGRITGDQPEVVVAFRHVPGPHPVRDGLPGVRWVDASGTSAHLGIYRHDDLHPLWVAGMVPAPIVDIAACDGAVALAYGALDDPSVSATGAAEWRPTGLDAAERLAGPGVAACADVDGDGVTEPVIIDRPSALPIRSDDPNPGES